MSKSISFLLFSTIVATVAAIAFVYIQLPELVHASAPAGLQATLATSSNPVVTNTAATVFATSTCAARIVSTTGNSAIMITFTDKDTPSGLFGHWQAASTTVAYDSGQYGCGKVKIYSFSSQNITVSESR